MKRLPRKPPAISVRAALRFLLRPGARLTLTMIAGRVEYSVGGGRISADAARRIISRSDIVAADAGLFADHSQSWQRLPKGADHA